MKLRSHEVQGRKDDARTFTSSGDYKRILYAILCTVSNFWLLTGNHSSVLLDFECFPRQANRRMPWSSVRPSDLVESVTRGVRGNYSHLVEAVSCCLCD